MKIRILLVTLLLSGVLVPGANAITFDLAFTGAKLIPENGVVEGSDLGGVRIPNSYPIPEILEFGPGAVLGYYSGDRNFGVDTVGWGGNGTFDTVDSVSGGPRGMGAFADYLEYTHPNDGPLRRRNAFITDTVPTDADGNFRGPGAASNVVAFNFLLPVYDLNFYAMDIDAPNDDLAEKFVAQVYGIDGLLGTIEIFGNDSLLDQIHHR